jgi:hypothetical protein
MDENLDNEADNESIKGHRKGCGLRPKHNFKNIHMVVCRFIEEIC